MCFYLRYISSSQKLIIQINQKMNERSFYAADKLAQHKKYYSIL